MKFNIKTRNNWDRFIVDYLKEIKLEFCWNKWLLLPPQTRSSRAAHPETSMRWQTSVFFFCLFWFIFFFPLSVLLLQSVGNHCVTRELPKHYITGKEIIFHFQHNLIRKKSRFSNSLESSVCTVCLHQFQYVIYDSLIELLNKTIRKLQTWKFGKR